MDITYVDELANRVDKQTVRRPGCRAAWIQESGAKTSALTCYPKLIHSHLP